MKMNEIVKTKTHYPAYKGTTIIIDTIINFMHNRKAVTLSSGKEVCYARNGVSLHRICRSRYSGKLYLQVAGQIFVNHSQHK